jgi:hypothetical protein
MLGPPQISKNQTRGRPFAKGGSGNPGGRPRRTEEEARLIEACREKTAAELGVIVGLMEDSANDRVRLAAAQFIIERGWGKAPERIALLDARERGPLPGAELTPLEAYMAIIECKSFEGIRAALPDSGEAVDDNSFSLPIFDGKNPKQFVTEQAVALAAFGRPSFLEGWRYSFALIGHI